MKQLIVLLLLFTAQIVPLQSHAQTAADPALAAEIAKIKAIDNHAHPLKYVAPGEKPDDEFDALPLDAIVPFPLPVRLSPANPEFIRAWHDLYRYSHNDMSEAHMRELMAAKQCVLNKRGAANPRPIATRLANMVSMLS